MSAKPLFCAVLLGLGVAWSAQAQPFAAPPPGSFGMALQPAQAPPASMTPSSNGFEPLPGTAAASWMNSAGSFPIGRDGPIGQEVFWLTGPTLPLGPSVLATDLSTGWMSEAGLRTLLFNPSNDAAWTLSTGLAFQYVAGTGTAPTFDFFGLNVRAHHLFRWSVTPAIGRDWFFQGRAPFGGPQDSLRFGIDCGGRLGTEHVDLSIANVAADPFNVKAYLRKHDVFGGVVVGAHTEIEIPMESWVFFAGARAEWGYDWSQLLITHNSSLQDVNLLFSFGVRY
jgi:hypothetical protein